jgi:hypothetical protein
LETEGRKKRCFNNFIHSKSRKKYTTNQTNKQPKHPNQKQFITIQCFNEQHGWLPFELPAENKKQDH